MAGKKTPERIYRMGGSDPRSGTERLAGAINRGVQPKAIKAQNRRWDDSPTKMAKNVKAADAERARQGITSRSPKPRGR